VQLPLHDNIIRMIGMLEHPLHGELLWMPKVACSLQQFVIERNRPFSERNAIIACTTVLVFVVATFTFVVA
jgi:hypothetical protein